MTTTTLSGKAAVRTAALVLALLLGSGCSELNIPEYNNPSIEDLTGNPTPAGIQAAAVGMQIGARSDMTGRTSYVSMLGTIGRESYTLDVSDPRYITELLVGPVTNSGAFGAGLWTARYANIRLGNIILDALPNVAAYTDGQRAAVRGFVQTIQALDFLLVINARDVNGAPIDVGGAIDELAALETKPEVFARIVQLLEAGRTDLASAGGTPFPFPLSDGFAGFNTPATFIQFNRALRARVDVYMGNYPAALTALGQSFLNTAQPLTRGVYNTYGTGSDAPNELATPLVFAHPSIVTDAQTKPDATPDNRLLAKVGPHPSGSRTLLGVTSDRAFLLYPQVTTSVPIIRNEELILLRAEARWFTGDPVGAMADLNFIRATAGGLAPIAAPASNADFVTALLRERRYSLLFEGGHRWIDNRRFGRLNTLPLDVATHIRIAAFQVPEAECLARSLSSPCTAS